MAALEGHPLRDLLLPQWDFELAEDTGADSPEWLQRDGWQLFVGAGRAGEGEPFAEFVRADGSRLAATVGADGRVHVPFSLAEAYRRYVAEEWRAGSENRRLSPGSLALFYRVRALIPRRAQLWARRVLVRAQGVPDFPAWPLELGVVRLVQFYAECGLRAAGRAEGEFTWFWPGGRQAAVILTHDVESEDGIARALALADVEEARGFRSSFNFGAWYDPDPGVLAELRTRGFEVGMHGLTHDRQLFSSREAFEARLPALRDLAAKLAAVGFRSPATHRVFEWLGELPIEYDCTLPLSDPYEPQPGGCCSIWPFFIGPVVELPYTLPQDHTLLTLLGHGSPELWLAQARALRRHFGLIQCVSHPDAGYLGDRDKLAVYAEFLDGLGDEPAIWRALPREVAAWWKARQIVAADQPRGRARLGDAGVEFIPPA